MLVLTRKAKESVVVGTADGPWLLLTITVLGITRGQVRLGFDADASVPVHRLEVWQRIQTGGETDGPTRDPVRPGPG